MPTSASAAFTVVDALSNFANSRWCENDGEFSLSSTPETPTVVALYVWSGIPAFVEDPSSRYTGACRVFYISTFRIHIISDTLVEAIHVSL